jgi:ABC-type uncharacterized transport system auxiliary subunit
MNALVRVGIFAICGVISIGCALTNKAEPLSIRYFTPPYHELANAEVAGTSAPLVIRVNRVEVAEHLTETIAFRRSESEVAYYDTLRWTEPPDIYLDRAIDDVLFSGSEMRRGITDPAYTISVELEAFEELKYGTRRARVAIYVSIADEHVVVREGRLSAEVPVIKSEQGPEVALVSAFGRALNDIALAVRQKVRAVAAEQREEASRLSDLATAPPLTTDAALNESAPNQPVPALQP